jgi:hypothetical protein
MGLRSNWVPNVSGQAAGPDFSWACDAGKWVDTVSLIAIEHPAFHEGGHTAEPNPKLH